MRLLLPLAALLLLVPAVAADRFDVTFLQVGQMRIQVESEVPEEDAAQVRAVADQDQDGTVSRQEADDLETAYMEEIREESEQDLVENITMDGRQPTGATFEDLEFRGLVGDTDSTAPMTGVARATVRFSVTAGDQHTLRLMGGNEGDPEGDDPIVLKAPPGYVISSHTGADGTPSLSADRTTLTFTDKEDPGSLVTIVFSKQASGTSATTGGGISTRPDGGTKGSPHAGVAFLALSLAFVASRLRR